MTTAISGGEHPIEGPIAHAMTSAVIPSQKREATTGRARWTLEESLKDHDVEEPVDRVLHRPLAFRVIQPLQHRGSSVLPWHVSLLSLLCGWGGALLWALSPGRGPWPIWAGSLLIFASVVFDCADGQLARLRGGGTHFGKMLDASIDLLVGMALWVGLTRAALQNLDGWWPWLISALVGLSTIAHVALYDQYKEAFEQGLRGEADPEPDPSSLSRLERGAMWLRHLVYGQIYSLAGGASGDPALTPEAYRSHFGAPMRRLAWSGVGSHFASFYVLAAIFAPWPELILYSTFAVVVVAQNALVIGALRQWRSAQRGAAAEQQALVGAQP